jgi:glucose-6-phosphate 1-dehydrogenase
MTDPDRRSPPCALIIFGASGDLTARKLLPALERLAAFGALAPHVTLIGVARTPMTDEEFRSYCRERVPGAEDPRWADLTDSARYVAGGYDDPATYQRLSEVLDGRDRGAVRRATGSSTSPRRRGCSGPSRSPSARPA